MKLLTTVTVLLFCASLSITLIRALIAPNQGIVALAEQTFGMNEEANIPMWFSAVMLLLAATLLACIGKAKRTSGERYGRHWSVLALLFLLLSLDEAAVLHEKSGRFLPAALDPEILYGWTVIGTLFVITVGLSYYRFFWALPRATQRRFAVAAACYVGGALGLEMIASYVNAGLGSTTYATSVWRVLLTNIEELLELTGLLVFLYALLCYFEQYVGTIQLSVVSARQQPPQSHAVEGES